MNYVEEYRQKIADGTILVPKKIQRMLDILKRQEQDEEFPYYFDPDVGELPILFIEYYCKTAVGKLGGDLKLELFQKVAIQLTFGWLNKETKLRRFRQLFLMVARKNGKTTLLAAIALYMLIADGEGSAEIFSVATKKDQAKLAFNATCKMLTMMKNKFPEFRKLVKKRKTDLYVESTFSSFMPLSSDSDTLDGLNSHLVIIDELHAIKKRSLYEVMYESLASRDQPLLVMITTNGTQRENIFDQIYEYASNVIAETYEDYEFLALIYELDEIEEWKNPECWIKANPGLGTIKKLSFLQGKVRNAKNDPNNLPGVLVKDFNMKANSSDSWLSMETVMCDKKFSYENLDCYAFGGVDLSATTDLTCATVLFKTSENSDIHVIQQYFIPKEIAKLKEEQDRVPYKIWHDKGWVTFTEGSRVNLSEVTDWFKKMRDEYNFTFYNIGYDPWCAVYFVEEMTREGFPMCKVIQGAMTMSQPMKDLKGDLMDKKVNYNENPVLRWCLLNTKIEEDKNDNIRPVKKSKIQRIDGTVSLINAYVVYTRDMLSYNASI